MLPKKGGLMSVNWQWLDELTRDDVLHQPVPFSQLLEESVYYPACYTDGDPVKYLSRLSRSFVYVDYDYGYDEMMRDFEHSGFHGYRMLAGRYVEKSEITPNGFHPHVLPSASDGDRSLQFQDGKPLKEPFAYWSIWQRREGYGEDHGPMCFSLFNMCGEGAACYDALYYTWETTPLIMCIIAPGKNWTTFRDSGNILHRVVKANPNGVHKYMLVDKREGYWPEYSNLVAEYPQLQGNSYLFLFRESE
jgi:hypothetical protein